MKIFFAYDAACYLVVSNAAGMCLNQDSGNLETYEATSDFQISLSEDEGPPNRRSAEFTASGNLSLTIYDASTDEAIGGLNVTLDADGNEITAIELSDSIDEVATSVDGIEVGGVTVMPIVATVSAGEVKSKNLTAYQYARLGPFTFSITDQTGASVDLTGHTVVFVASSDCEYLWQTDSTVSGNVVTVTDDDTNTGTAGELHYCLRDLTDDTVLARGELLIVSEVDAA